MTCLDFLLCFEWPELDGNGADDDVVSNGVVSERTQDIFRSVGDSVNDGLLTLIVFGVPDLDDLVGAETD